MFKRTVVGCDGSTEGRDAVALGSTVASAVGGGLSLVGVYPTSFLPVPGVTDRGSLREQADAALRRDRDLLAPEALIDSVADSSVPRALRHYAERSHAGLVVLGSNSSAPDAHAGIGRRGRQLLHDAPFSLALAHRGLHERGVELKAIGVGYDGGPEADAALHVAARLAEATGARLLVRSVIDDRVPAQFVDRAEVWAGLWATECPAAEARAKEATASLPIHAEVSATVGDPGYGLRELSNTVDLIVVGSRRWGPLVRLVAGGVGETLVADASCSVLLVPRPAAEQAEPPTRQQPEHAHVAT